MLRVDKHRITWRHEMYSDNSHKLDGEPRPEFRAVTTCDIHYEKEDNVRTYCGVGVAGCSWDDNFCRDTGRKISLKRALRDAGISSSLRRKIWEEYRVSMTDKPRW